jgi:hypothetical protein
MELEYIFLQTGAFTLFQFLFMSSLLIPSLVGRTDIFPAFVRTLASYVVSFGPLVLLGYVLHAVSKLQ